MGKGKIANEYGEIIGAYWFDRARNSYTLRLYHTNIYGYTPEGIIDWCNRYDCIWWEED